MAFRQQNPLYSKKFLYAFNKLRMYATLFRIPFDLTEDQLKDIADNEACCGCGIFPEEPLFILKTENGGGCIEPNLNSICYKCYTKRRTLMALNLKRAKGRKEQEIKEKE